MIQVTRDNLGSSTDVHAHILHTLSVMVSTDDHGLTTDDQVTRDIYVSSKDVHIYPIPIPSARASTDDQITRDNHRYLYMAKLLGISWFILGYTYSTPCLLFQSICG